MGFLGFYGLTHFYKQSDLGFLGFSFFSRDIV